jgi:hypothetical protein
MITYILWSHSEQSSSKLSLTMQTDRCARATQERHYPAVLYTRYRYNARPAGRTARSVGTMTNSNALLTRTVQEKLSRLLLGNYINGWGVWAHQATLVADVMPVDDPVHQNIQHLCTWERVRERERRYDGRKPVDRFHGRRLRRRWRDIATRFAHAVEFVWLLQTHRTAADGTWRDILTPRDIVRGSLRLSSPTTVPLPLYDGASSPTRPTVPGLSSACLDVSRSDCKEPPRQACKTDHRATT